MENETTKVYYIGMSKRDKIRLITFVTAAIIALLIFGLTSYTKAIAYRTQLSYINERSLEDLADSIKSIDIDLKKGLYSNSDYQLAIIAENLKGECENAKVMLSLMPSYDLNLEKLNKFISQTGNYAVSIAKTSSQNELLSAEERQNLEKLQASSDEIYQSIQTLLANINEQDLSNISNARSIYESGDNDYDSAVSDNLTDIEEGFDDYPTLIYDGPFSDHILNSNPLLLKNKQEISMKEATSRAAKYLSVNESDLTFSGEEQGNMPSYIFSLNNSSTVTVSKAGGYLVYMLRTRSVGEEKIDTNDAVAIAKKAAADAGFGNTAESYYTVYDGVITVNLAHTENGIVYYTDLIKVSVSLDDGSIQMIDARGYVMNHHDRETPDARISVDDAAKKISPSLKIESSRLTVIPSDNREELSCFEFACKGKNNEDILVYINTVTGNEEQIQIIVHTPGGSLAM